MYVIGIDSSRASGEGRGERVSRIPSKNNFVNVGHRPPTVESPSMLEGVIRTGERTNNEDEWLILAPRREGFLGGRVFENQ